MNMVSQRSLLEIAHVTLVSRIHANDGFKATYVPTCVAKEPHGSMYRRTILGFRKPPRFPFIGQSNATGKVEMVPLRAGSSNMGTDTHCTRRATTFPASGYAVTRRGHSLARGKDVLSEGEKSGRPNHT